MRAGAYSRLCLALLTCTCGSGADATRKDAAGGADAPDARLQDQPADAPGTDAAQALDMLLPDAAAAADQGLSADLSAQERRDSDGPANLADAGAGLEAAVEASPPMDGGLAVFCTGDSPRMVVNGAPVTPTIKGDRIVMDTLDGGQFTITNADLDFPVGVSWRMPAASSSLPITIDLANPPSTWQLMVAAGCNVTSAGCLGPMDYYSSGLVGWLSVARDSSGKFDMSVCIHVDEMPGETKHWLHSLDFYAMHVLTW